MLGQAYECSHVGCADRGAGDKSKTGLRSKGLRIFDNSLKPVGLQFKLANL